MTAISGVSSPTANYITHDHTLAKNIPTTNPPTSSTAIPPGTKDADGDTDGGIGTKINTFA